MSIKRLSSDEFRKQVDGDEFDPAEVEVSKFVVGEEIKASKTEDGKPTYKFIFSTGATDREGDTIRPKGWKLTNYKRAGSPVLWAHNASEPPIGRALSMKVEDDRLRGEVEFLSEDINPLAESIRRMVEAGVLRATSVGFLPLKFELDRDDEGWVRGVDFQQTELLEGSIVPIPANPEALRERGIKSLDLRPVIEWHERELDGEGTLVVPRDIVEQSWKAIKPEPAPVAVDVLEEIAAVVDAEAKTKGAISWRAAHPEGTPVAERDESWEGPGEIAAAEVDDLAVMSAWVEDGEADTKAAYKLPHHRADDKALVWRGLTAAMGALLGARGGVDIPDDDRRAVYNHLARHYRTDFDAEPPEFRAYEAAELRGLGLEVTQEDETVDEVGEGQASDEAEPAPRVGPREKFILAARELVEAQKELAEAGDLDDEIVELTQLIHEATANNEGDWLDLMDDEQDTIKEAKPATAVDDDAEDWFEVEDPKAFGDSLRKLIHERLVMPLTGRVL